MPAVEGHNESDFNRCNVLPNSFVKWKVLTMRRRIRTAASKSATFLLTCTRESNLASIPRWHEETDYGDMTIQAKINRQIPVPCGPPMPTIWRTSSTLGSTSPTCPISQAVSCRLESFGTNNQA